VQCACIRPHNLYIQKRLILPPSLSQYTVQCCLFAAHNQPTSLAFHVFKYLTRLFKHWLQLESCTGMRILPVPNRTRGLHTRPQPYPWTSHPYPSVPVTKADFSVFTSDKLPSNENQAFKVAATIDARHLFGRPNQQCDSVNEIKQVSSRNVCIVN
jgi:hypothetical protein